VNQPDCPKEKYGASTVMIPALEAAVTLNDRRVVDVAGRADTMAVHSARHRQRSRKA